MQNSWWTKPEEMDPDQKRFVSLDADGRHLLLGPPGSGKTNLLVLRARYIYGSGLKNVLLLTFTRSLQDFIRTGVAEKKYLGSEQIQTFKSWALRHCATYAPDALKSYDKTADFETQRMQLIGALQVASSRVQGKNSYDAILVDEVQDLRIEEIQALLPLSERITVAGDSKQSIYETGHSVEEIKKLGFQTTTLTYHYRIGTAIADTADKALQPKVDADRLRANCQYREDTLQSRAELYELPSREAQFDAMLRTIELQLRSYPGEGIGVFAPLRATVDELRARFEATSLAGAVAYHTEKSDEHSFLSGKLIHVLPLKSSKGTEFRAVHLFALEELQYPQHRRELLFMAVTRARTALAGYHTGKVLGSVATAFSRPGIPPSLEELL